MAQRPEVIVFDVMGTLFPIEPIGPLGERLAEAGLPATLARPWIARILRDGFALEIAGLWRPFHDVAEASLAGIAAETGQRLGDQARRHVVAALRELPADPYARAALEGARAAGVTTACLTNASAVDAEALLHRAGLSALVARVICADEIQHWKPLWDVYLHAADELGAQPADLALVSAHDWDLEGARQASLTTAWVERDDYSPLHAPPDIIAPNLSAAVERLLALPRNLGRPPHETLH